VVPTERIQRLIDPAYVAAIDTRSLEELQSMKTQCNEIENALSYDRRLAQARVEILEAEHDRRESGGTVEDLVKDLPRILSDESGRSSITDTRVPPPDAPTVELHWPDGREELIADTTLANLPVLPAEELDSTLERLRAFERELSDLRREIHVVIDKLEREIASRQVAGTAG
jgi:DNA repair exonuclease SbcCD ATPase subunit